MIKAGQAATLTLTVNDVATATSGHTAYQNPKGQTGTWDGTLDASALTVVSSIPEGDLSVSGRWRVIAVITYGDGTVVNGTSHEFVVYNRFD